MAETRDKMNMLEEMGITPKDWEVWRLLEDGEGLASELAFLGVELARGDKYTELRIVPIQSLLGPRGLEADMKGHVVYGKLTDERKFSRDSGGYLRRIDLGQVKSKEGRYFFANYFVDPERFPQDE